MQHRTGPISIRLSRRALALLLAPLALLLALLPAGALAQSSAVPLVDLGYSGWTVASDDLLFFVNDDAEHGAELWCSDGTPAGTRLVKDIAPAGSSSQPGLLGVAGGRLYFTASDPDHGRELWVSDGTEAGTVLVRDITPGPDSTGELWDGIDALGALGDKMLLAVPQPDTGREPWISDGTEAGTVLLEDINPGVVGSYPGYSFGTLGNLAIFAVNDYRHGDEFWVTDGTEAGTTLLRDLRIGPYGSYPSEPVLMNGRLYFLANSGGAGVDLWQTDGTAAGTSLIASMQASIWNLELDWWVRPEVIGNQVYFQMLNAQFGLDLWVSDGTQAGTHVVMPSGSSGWLIFLQSAGDAYYFPGYSQEHGTELWRSDGTEAGTRMVKDVNSGTLNSSPDYFTQVRDNGLTFFSAATEATGVELWATDGTPGGTFLWQDLVPGPESANPEGFTKVGDYVFFQTGTFYDSDSTLWVVRVEPPTDGAAIFLPAVRQ